MVDTYYGASIIIFSLSLCLSYFRCFTSSITFQISDLFIFIIFFCVLVRQELQHEGLCSLYSKALLSFVLSSESYFKKSV